MQFLKTGKNEKERKEYLDLLKKLNSGQSHNHIVQNTIDKYWELMNDICKVFGENYDRNEKELYDEFRRDNSLKSSPDTADNGAKNCFRCLGWVTEEVYRKYQYIQSADYDLFAYGVLRRGQLLATQQELEKQVNEQFKLATNYERSYKTLADENSDLQALP